MRPEITVPAIDHPTITPTTEKYPEETVISNEAIMEEVLKAGKKIRIFWYSDFLRPTGFGNVAEAIISRLSKTGKYDFRVLGINHHGEPYNFPESPYYHLRDVPVYPALHEGDLLGRQRFADMIGQNSFDILFVLQDAFNMIPLKEAIQAYKEAHPEVKYVFYFPVDGQFPISWITDGVDVADFPVAYTNYGKAELTKRVPVGLDRVEVIYHGTDVDMFTPFSTEGERREFRKEFFHIEDDNTFLITNVNRNQPRKDLIRTIAAYTQYAEGNPNSMLYLHCDTKDGAGMDMVKFIRENVPKALHNKISFPPIELMRRGGVPKDVLRKMYAASDVVVSTSLGEGWGLSTTEAMSCETPVIVPDNTSNVEIVGKNNERGYLVKSGSTSSEWFVQKYDNDLVRPLTNIDDFVAKLGHVFSNREEAKEKARAGRKWLVENYTWDKIADIWDKKLTDIYINQCLPAYDQETE